MMNVDTLYQVSLPSKIMSESVAFYEDVIGLALIARFDQPVKLAFFRIGETRLMVEESDEVASGSCLYVKVKDLESKIEKLEELGIDVVSKPHIIHHDESGQFGAAGESELMAFIKDPTGNLVGLVERLRVE